jgi:hypothetical protein
VVEAEAVVARFGVLDVYVVGAEIGGEMACVPHDDVRRGDIVVVGTRGCDEGAEPRGVPAGPSLEPVGGLEGGAGEMDGLSGCEGDGRNVVGWAGLDGEGCAVSADAGLVDVDVAGVAGEEGGGDESGARCLACEETDAVGAGGRCE